MNVVMLLDNCFEPDVRVYKEAKYLVDCGNEVEVLCLDKKNKYLEKSKEICEGIQIKRFFVRREKTTKLIEKNIIVKKLKLFIYFKWLLNFKNQVKEYLSDKGEYDVIHCHDLTMTMLACVYLKKHPIVFDMHEYYSNKKSKILNWFIRKMVKYTQNKATWIIHVNDFQTKDVKEKEKLIYLPNYPSKSLYEPIEKTKNDNIRINYIGATRDLNSLMILGQLEDCEVGIYGIGTAYEILKSEYKNKSNVRVYGKFDGITECGRIYRNTDILYCMYNPNNLNWRTAYPVKMYEAIITKTPIIVSKDTMAAEFVKKHEIGVAVEYANKEELKKAIIEIKNNYSKYVDAAQMISNRYCWEEVQKNLRRYIGGMNESQH